MRKTSMTLLARLLFVAPLMATDPPTPGNPEEVVEKVIVTCGPKGAGCGHGAGMMNCGPIGQGCGPGMMMMDCCPEGSECFPEDCILDCAAQIGLTEAQIEQIKKASFSHREMMIDHKAAMQKLRLKMRQAEESKVMDKALILSLSDQINALQGKIKRARIEHRFGIREMLNEEQLKKLQECREKCGGMAGGKPGLGSCGPAQGEKHACGAMLLDGSCMPKK